MNNFWKFLGILGSISSIIGIFSAFYFYNQAKEAKEPFFIETNIKTKLIESKNLKNAPFKIIRFNNIEILDNVTSTAFYFWNQGKKPIKREDILDSLIVFLPDSCEILKFEILGQTRNVCNVALIQIDKNRLKLDFDIIENSDGFVAQIIFIGDENQNLKLTGNIEGVKELNVPKKKHNLILKFGIAFLFTVFSYVMGAIMAIYFNLKKSGKEGESAFKKILKKLFLSDSIESRKFYIVFLVIVAVFTLFLYNSNLVIDDIENLIPKEIRKIIE